MQFISMSTYSDLHYLQPSVDYYDVKKTSPICWTLKLSALKNVLPLKITLSAYDVLLQID